MANQMDDGRWQGFDGKIYNSEGEANTQGAGSVSSSGSTVAFGRAMQAVMGVLGILPGLVANAVGFVFSGLTGFTGRILQSIIFALAAVSFGIMAIARLLPKEFDTSISSGTLWIIAGFVAVWYFIWHYRAVRCMSVAFNELLKTSFTIIVFGALFMFLVIVFTPLKNSPIQDFFVMGIPIIIAFVVYFIGAIPYMKQAAELRRTNQPLPEEDDENLADKLFEITEDGGLILIISGLVITIGVIAVGIILHSEIFKPSAVRMGFIIILLCAVLSVMTFVGLKLGYEKKPLRIFVYVAFVIALFGGHCVLKGGIQVLPNIFYDIAKLERPNEKMPEIKKGGAIETHKLSFAREVYDVPKIYYKSRKTILKIPANETIKTTGRKAGDFIEISYKDVTGWVVKPNAGKF